MTTYTDEEARRQFQAVLNTAQTKAKCGSEPRMARSTL